MRKLASGAAEVEQCQHLVQNNSTREAEFLTEAEADRLRR